MKISAACSAGAMALSLATAASGQVIYNNGGPNGSSGNDATQWVQTEDFSFGANATVTGAGVYMAGFGAFPDDWDGSFQYYIFGDNAGDPGATLATGAVAVTPVDTATGSGFGGSVYLLEFDFLSDFNALAGTTYWLGIHASSNFDRDDLYWVTTNSNLTQRGHESNGGTFDNWFNNGQEHAYYLTGDRNGAIPEPGAWALMILGFGAAGSALRHRRRVPA